MPTMTATQPPLHSLSGLFDASPFSRNNDLHAASAPSETAVSSSPSAAAPPAAGRRASCVIIPAASPSAVISCLPEHPTQHQRHSQHASTVLSPLSSSHLNHRPAPSTATTVTPLSSLPAKAPSAPSSPAASGCSTSSASLSLQLPAVVSFTSTDPSRRYRKRVKIGNKAARPVTLSIDRADCQRLQQKGFSMALEGGEHEKSRDSNGEKESVTVAALSTAFLCVSYRQLEAHTGSSAITVSQELRLQEGEGQHYHALQLLVTVMPALPSSIASTPTISPASSSHSALSSPASSLASPVASFFPFSSFPASSSAFPHAAQPPRPRARRDSQQSVRPAPRTIRDWLSAAAQFAYSTQTMPLPFSPSAPAARSARSLSTSSSACPASASASSSASAFPSRPTSPAVSSELKQRRSSEPHCYTLSSQTVYTPTSGSPLLAAASSSRPSVSVSLTSSSSVSQTVSPASSSSASLSPLQHSRYFSLPSELLRPLTTETEEETVWTDDSKQEAEREALPSVRQLR